MKAQSFKDLAKMRAQLAETQALEAAREAARRAEAARVLAAKNLFVRAVGAVKRLPEKPVVQLDQDLPPPIPVQHQKDEAEVMRESISDNFDVSSLLDTDDALSFRRPGISVEVTRKLRRGEWSIQREIDLHGMRTDEAREALGPFIREAHKHGIRCVRVVHGKGLGSPGKTPVLKGRVQSWLVQKKEVLAFVQAKPAEGGAGALVVLLIPMQPRHG